MFSVSTKGSIADKSASTETQQRVTAQGEAKVSVSGTKKSPKQKKGGLPKDSPWRGLGRYSLVIEGGGGGENFHNGKGIDHGGGTLGAAFGLMLDLGKDKRHVLNPYFALRHQWLKKDLGQGVLSQAGVLHFAVGVGYRYRVHPKWFSVGPEFEIGAGHYKAAEPVLNLDTGISKGGAEFNKNASVLSLNKAGFHVAGGLKMCTVGQSLCAGVRLFADVGVNPRYDFVDVQEGSNPPMGFSPRGVQGGVSLDFLQLLHFAREQKKSKTAKKEAKKNPAAPSPAPAKSTEIVPKPSASAATPPAVAVKKAELSVTEWVQTTAVAVERAEAAVRENERHLADIRLEGQKGQPDLAAMRFHAKDAIDRGAEASDAAQDGRKAQRALEAKIEASSGEKRMDASRGLKSAQDNTAKIDRSAAQAHLGARQVYETYAAKAGKDRDLDWSLDAPPGGLEVARSPKPKKEKKPTPARTSSSAAKPEPEVVIVEPEGSKKDSQSGNPADRCKGPLKDLYPECKAK